jgi:predicted acylesterase/phospholipase RssA
MDPPAPPATPLEKIALSCSGGGYRAASFHLGTMSYLHSVSYQGAQLLEKVKMLSTVSGGTITGIVYTLHRQQGKSFEAIYHFLLEKLRTLDLLKLGIEKLNPDKVWRNTTKQKNLINAFAELYDEHFTGGATFAEFDHMRCHLEAVAFNSTEFNNAVDFRFRNRGAAIFGNYYLRVTNAQAAEVRLSDAMAASSCFPGGFEPILWPHDFIHENAPHLKSLKSQAPVGIMDGGIYDNQGIDTILRYKGAAENETPYFDCIIISDVSSPYMNPFAPAPEKPKLGIHRITLRQLYRRAKAVNRLTNWLVPTFAVFLACLPLAWRYTNTIGTGVSLTLAGVVLVGWCIKRMLLGKVTKLPARFMKFLLAKNPHMGFYVQKLSNLDLGELSLHRARPLLLDRLNSLLSLLLNVFLKVVRRLNYNLVYNDERWQYRRIGNLIHELTRDDYETQGRRISDERTAAVLGKSIFTGDYAEDVGKNIQAVAEAASDFGTTLWFTPEDQLGGTLDKLVATGQFTMCYNLIEYLENLLYSQESAESNETTMGNEPHKTTKTARTNESDQHNAIPPSHETNADPPSSSTTAPLRPQTKADLQNLLAQCTAHWAQFKIDPYFMLKTFDKAGKIPPNP